MKYPRVLTIGVFDLFHIGHLRYLQYARTQGDHLSVAVTSDAVTFAVKGKYPVIPEAQRMEIIRGFDWVDFADLLPCSTTQPKAAAQWIRDWKINHVVAGGEWSNSERWSNLSLELTHVGISVGFAPHTTGISTTQIIATICNSKSNGITNTPHTLLLEEEK